MARGNKGFTLIEILLVFAIIAILSTIVVPLLLGAREKAKNAACDKLFHTLDGEIANEMDTVMQKGLPNCGNMGTSWNDMKVIRCVIKRHGIEENPRNRKKPVFKNYLESPSGFESCQVGLDECPVGSWQLCVKVRQFPMRTGHERTFTLKID